MPFGYFRRMEDALNAFFGRFQFLFNFATEKFVVIKDWRLGLVLRLLQIGIFIYVLYDVINQASYLVQEVPKGAVSPSTDLTATERRDSVIEQRRKYDDASRTPPYCRGGGANYEYIYNSENYTDFQCVVMDPYAIPEPGETEFFLTTYLRLDKVYYVDMVQGRTNCPNPENIDEIPNRASKLGQFYGVCLYNAYEQYFPIDPEDIQLEIVHSYYTSIVGANGALPETVIRAKGHDGGKIHADDGEAIRLTMKDLLDITGVDLDMRLDEQQNDNKPSETSRDNDERPFPFARLSGVNLIMNFKYYHRALEPDEYKVSAGPKKDNVICIVEVEPQFTWTVKASDVHYQISDASHPFIVNPERERRTDGPSFQYQAVQVDFQRHGVQLTFQVSGNMGKFDFFSLVNALVAGAVLLGVAQTIVTYIALYALGLSSKLYAEFMRESVNWRKEYARFATQSLVAGNTFMAYDENDSNSLERKEIYQHLSKTFKEVLDPPKLACLADFLMRHGEMDADVSKGRLDDISDVKISTINMAEWVDIFTEEKVQINSLKRLVDSEYDNPKLVGILLGLAEGRIGRDLSTVQSGMALQITSQDLEEAQISSGDQASGEKLLEEGATSTKVEKKDEGGASKPPGDQDT